MPKLNTNTSARKGEPLVVSKDEGSRARLLEEGSFLPSTDRRLDFTKVDRDAVMRNLACHSAEWDNH